ncbi:hypothetical protein CQW23_08403 [Capsicum baccatum]|uniref:KIB1-4 beta-propeller domain-containing protein n=1 Tax=Capsicum baccatum TaxID=33114 RepID=A0A2G2X9C0_CAPBA|nr:hypothetical protein CQW23_08403 [Capsicum baccatum]
MDYVEAQENYGIEGENEIDAVNLDEDDENIDETPAVGNANSFIARRLNLIEDYLSFGTVCQSWHSAATKNNFNSDLPRVPWLMLAEEENNNNNANNGDNDGSDCRKFFSIYNGMILKKRIPKASGKRCLESMGWLMTVGKDDCMSNLSFWRPGDLRWTRIIWDQGLDFAAQVDVTYFNGHFYSVDYKGRVLVHDIARPQPATNVIAHLQFNCLDRQGQLYILESLGSLFVVVRHGVQTRYAEDDGDRFPLTYIRMEGEEKDEIYGTTNFRVFQVDLAAGKVTETRELGDTAFLIGNNASLSVQASQFSGIKSNHIYFTDDYWETHLFYQEGGGLDMGVFSLADGSIQPHYKGLFLSNICPPIWVTPTLY